MAFESDPLTAENYDNILAAESALADLDWFEDLADLHDTEPLPSLREQFVDQYRTITGIHPSQRVAFRHGLEHLIETGRCSVQDLIADLMRSQKAPPPSSPVAC